MDRYDKNKSCRACFALRAPLHFCECRDDDETIILLEHWVLSGRQKSAGDD